MARRLISPQLSPLFANLAKFFVDVGIPETADDQESKARVGEDDREENADCRQASDAFIRAIAAIHCGRRGRPPAEVLQNVASEVGHDEHSGQNGEDQRAVDLTVGAAALAAAPADVDVEAHHQGQGHTKTDVVAKGSCSGSYGARNKTDDQSGPASCSD